MSAAVSTVTSIVSLVPALDRRIEALIASLPDVDWLTPAERRGVIARYSSVLEGNFIYWMTGAYLSVVSEDARSIILENLSEEVRDCHPGMLRRFAIAANAVPTEADFVAVYEELMKVRLFVGRLPRVSLVLMMGFFESFIQRFMPYLQQLAETRGSEEREYTEVHGECDVIHTRELYRAVETEHCLANGAAGEINLFEGIELLDALIRKMVTG